MSELIIHKDTVYEPIDSQFYSGHQPVSVVKGEPTLSWKRGKIPLDMWQQVLSFFKWSYDETTSETQVRLLYNASEDKWAVWAFPQEHGTGMTTKEIDGDEKDRQRETFKGYTVAGTVHHHCSSPAFQSGTDKDNELSQDGVHITVGNLDKSQFDLHARVCRTSVMFNCSLGEWFEYPTEWNDILPQKYISPALSEVLTTPPDELSFPDEWRNNLIKVPKTYHPAAIYNGHYQGHGSIHRQTFFHGAHNTGFHGAHNPQYQKAMLPEEYTEIEKSDALYTELESFLFKYGEEEKIEAADMANEWEKIIFASHYLKLCQLIEDYDVDENLYIKVCDKMSDVHEEAAQKDAADDLKSEQESIKEKIDSHYLGSDDPYRHDYGISL